MESFFFLTLGVGDGFSALHYSSCLALHAGGEWLLIDCPHPIRKMMREAGSTAGVELDVDRVSGVVLTHLHADHASGVEGLGYATHFGLGRKARLLAHPAVSARLWDGHLAAGMEQLLAVGADRPEPRGLDDYFELTALQEDRPVIFGAFSIECRKTIHHIPTTALRIRAGDRCLGYSADASFDPSLIEWLSSADLIVHETNCGVHTPYESLAVLPAGLRQRMRLIHYPDEFDVAGSVIEPLAQGRTYAI